MVSAPNVPYFCSIFHWANEAHGKWRALTVYVDGPKNDIRISLWPMLMQPDPGAHHAAFLFSCTLIRVHVLFSFFVAWSWSRSPLPCFSTPGSGSLFYCCQFSLLPIPGAFNDDMFWLRILCFGFCRYFSIPLFYFDYCFQLPCFLNWLFSISRRTGYFPHKLVFFCLNWLFSGFGYTIRLHART